MACPQVPWEGTEALTYGAYGKRKVLILFSDVPLPNCSEAVSRRDGHLTEKDREKLRSENVDLEYRDTEVDIVQKRYKLDTKKSTFKTLQSTPEKLITRQEAYDYIAVLMNNIENDGVVLYYVGAGRRNTGDWCFSDGYVTFRDIVDLYLQATHLKGRVLTIVSDCSYSGQWVKDCERFLDDNGVQPCGHRAKEKGRLIKVYASCLPSQIPTQFQLIVHGGGNDKRTGDKYTESYKYLLETQHTFSVNSSRLRCDGKTIDDKCTLKPKFTWENLRLYNRIHLETYHGDDGQSRWHYVELNDDEEVICNVKCDKLPVSSRYVRVIKSGEGGDPCNDVKDSIEREFGPCMEEPLRNQCKFT